MKCGRRFTALHWVEVAEKGTNSTAFKLVKRGSNMKLKSTCSVQNLQFPAAIKKGLSRTQASIVYCEGSTFLLLFVQLSITFSHTHTHAAFLWDPCLNIHWRLWSIVQWWSQVCRVAPCCVCVPGHARSHCRFRTTRIVFFWPLKESNKKNKNKKK